MQVSPRVLSEVSVLDIQKRWCGPKTMEESLKLQNIKVRRFGDDVLIRGYPSY